MSWNNWWCKSGCIWYLKFMVIWPQSLKFHFDWSVWNKYKSCLSLKSLNQNKIIFYIDGRLWYSKACCASCKQFVRDSYVAMSCRKDVLNLYQRVCNNGRVQNNTNDQLLVPDKLYHKVALITLGRIVSNCHTIAVPCKSCYSVYSV